MNDKYKTSAMAALDYLAQHRIADDGGALAQAVRCIQPPPLIRPDLVLNFYNALIDGTSTIPDLGLSKAFRSRLFSPPSYPVYTLLAALSDSDVPGGRAVAKSLLPLFESACNVAAADSGTDTIYRHCLAVRDVLVQLLKATNPVLPVLEPGDNHKKFYGELAVLVGSADLTDVDGAADKQICTIDLLLGDRKFGVAETHRSVGASYKKAPKLDVNSERGNFYREGGANCEGIANFEDIFLLERSACSESGVTTVTTRPSYHTNPEYRTHESLLRDARTISNTDSPSDPTTLPPEFICAGVSLLVYRLRDPRLHGWLALRLITLMGTDRLRTLQHTHCLDDALAADDGVWLTSDGYLCYVVQNMADTAVRRHMIVRLGLDLTAILIESMATKPASYWVDRLSKAGNRAATFATPILLVRASDKWHSLSSTGLDQVHRGLLKGELTSDRKTRMTYLELPHAHLQNGLVTAASAYRSEVLEAEIGPPTQEYSSFLEFFCLPSSTLDVTIGGDICRRERVILNIAKERASALLSTRKNAIRRGATPIEIILRLNAAVDDCLARTAFAHALRPLNKISELHLVSAFGSCHLRIYEKYTGTAIETHMTQWNFNAAGFDPRYFLRDWVHGVEMLVPLRVTLSGPLERRLHNLRTFLDSENPIRACDFRFGMLTLNKEANGVDLGQIPRFVPLGYDIPDNAHRSLALTISALQQSDALNAAVAGHECTLSMCDPLSSAPITALRPLQLPMPLRPLPRLWVKYS